MPTVLRLLFFVITFSAIGQPIVYVTQNGAGDASGTSWTNALSGTLLAGRVAIALPATQFWVAAGTYKPTTTTDRTASFSIPSGVSIYGGFRGTENQPDERVINSETILSGDIGISGDRSDNSMNVVQIVNTNQPVVFNTITIRGGNRGSTESQSEGIGIRVRATGTPTQLYLYSCKLIDNRISPSLNGGGAILFRADAGATCKLVVQDCLFDGNEAGTGGAIALYTVGGTIDAQLVHSTFVNNRGNEGGVLNP